MIGNSNGSMTVQFFDIMGNPIGVKGRKLSAAKLVYISGDTVDATSVATLDENAGKVTIKLGKLADKVTRGVFYPQLTLTDKKGDNLSFKTTEHVTMQTTVSFLHFLYKITDSEWEHTTQGSKKWEHPAQISDFQTQN